MKIAAAVSMCVLAVSSACLYAQESLVGKYSGSLTAKTFRAGTEQVGLDLVIASAEGGKLTGTTVLHGGNCRGEYPMVGKYDANKVFMRSTTSGGPSGDCKMGLRLNVEGTKLVGETGAGLPVELSKK